MRFLRYWMCRRPLRRVQLRCSGVEKATLESQPRRSRDQMPSTGLRSGASPCRRWQSPLGPGRRQILNRAPAASCPTGQAPGPQRHTMMVMVVPDEDERAAELLVGGDQQVSVVAPGEAFAPVTVAVVPAGPVDQPGSVAGFVAGRRGDRFTSARAAADPHHRGPAALGSGLGMRRRHGEAGFVLEDQPGSTSRR
jgi:hypothetical protein